jgi:sulfate transport system permease protein
MSSVAASIAPPRARWRNPSALPGFGLSLGFTLSYLTLIVLIPLSALVIRPWTLGISGVWEVITEPRVLHALKLSFGASAIAALINMVVGVIIAWALTRYKFPGKTLIDAFVDLPFALPTAVAGIALSTI